MNLTDVSLLRISNQQIGGSKFRTAKEIANWMGAFQAQDFSMARWAFGIRLRNSTESTIDNAINSGDLIRTHLLRPTWHLVSSDDIYWILELTAPRIKAATGFRDRQLGLTAQIFNKSNSIMERALSGGNHLTRDELISELVNGGIELGENRASHILVRAETDGLICSGKLKGAKPTYALLGEWVPVENLRSREESLKELALRYFRSRGPATLKDFSWWSGLSLKDSKHGLEMNKTELASTVIDDLTFWFGESPGFHEQTANEMYLLPAYDEFLIGYNDRRASIPAGNHGKAVSNNGVFYPTIVQNGQILGTWKRKIKKGSLLIETRLFEPDNIFPEDLFSKAAASYSGFLNKVLA